MTPKDPGRRRRDDSDAGDTEVIVLRPRLLTPEEDPYGGVRIGRPARSPSLPPEQPPAKQS